jgi:hypothetical protein
LLMLAAFQGWRRGGGAWRLVAGALAAWLAGAFWTIGHAAGPVGAVYLWADGRPRRRAAAAVPLFASVLAVVLALVLGGRQINAKISFHGRTSTQAVDPLMGISHTLQAIPENLVLGNLGLVAEATVLQDVALCLALAVVWAGTHTRRTAASDARFPIIFSVYVIASLGALLVIIARTKSLTAAHLVLPPVFFVLGLIVMSDRGSPLERAGAALVLLAYVGEWSFRGYLPFSSLRGIVPWYDSIPQIGAVLFLAGWLAGARPPLPVRSPGPVTSKGAFGILLFELAMVLVHQPRVDGLFTERVPKMTAEKAKVFVTSDLQKARARDLAELMARRQRRHLARLDRAQAVARRLGIGREGIRLAFGRVDLPELPEVYDATPMLDLPWKGKENDPAVIRHALSEFFAMEPEPTVPVGDFRKSGGKQ